MRNINKIIVLMLILFLSGCTESEIEYTTDEGSSLFDLRQSLAESSNFNSLYILDSLQSAVQNRTISVVYSDQDSLQVTYNDGNEDIVVHLRASQTQDGEFETLWINDSPVALNAGLNYFTSSYQIGIIEDFPKVVSLAGTNAAFVEPAFSGIKSQEYINIFLEEGFVLDGLYRVSRNLVNGIIFQGLLRGDSLVDFLTVEESVYALMQINESQYVVWYDGVHLTLSGNANFYKGGS